MKKYVYRDSEGNAMECYSAATVDERIAHLKAASARDHAKEHALTARVAELEGALAAMVSQYLANIGGEKRAEAAANLSLAPQTHPYIRARALLNKEGR